jgi:hypothetical protein
MATNGGRSIELQWKTIRPTEATRSLLDRAASEFNRISAGRFHIIRQPFGRIVACPCGDLLFFHVGDGGRPPEILTLAVSTGPEPRSFFPVQRTGDFDECCRLLGLQDGEQREGFKSFLLPRSPTGSRCGTR